MHDLLEKLTKIVKQNQENSQLSTGTKVRLN